MTNKLQAQILEMMGRGSYAPLTAEAILKALQGAAEPDQLWKELWALEEGGQVVRTRYGTYGLPQRMGLAAGRLQMTSKGYSFLISDDREQEDVFIPQRANGGAMNNDRVLVRLGHSSRGKRLEGEVIRILQRANSKVVGSLHVNKDYAFVVADDWRLGQDIYVSKRNFNGAKNGQKVVVELTKWPQGTAKAEGRVAEVLGNQGDVGLEILSIIKQNDLPLEFPKEVLAASRQVPSSISPAELAGRRDLRQRLIVTIDGEDAKDLDDAVYVQKNGPDDYLLGVYIADVSYYVKEGSLLDKEALARGTSVYLVDRVLPMLPPRLSNGICSLNAGEDRLAMACEMHIDGAGQVRKYEIFPTVIRVRHRLSYNILRDLLNGVPETAAQYPDMVGPAALMDELRGILSAKRARRGAIYFDLPEQKVILDERLHPIEVVNRSHGRAEAVIEEFMLAANETVAQHLAQAQWPCVYRVHDVPDYSKMQELAKLLATFNVKFAPSEKLRPREVQRALEAVAGRPEERLVTTVALRSMKQAVYQTGNIGHFGLAASYYAHFTSPIRRYPDLLVHRLLRQWLQRPRLSQEEAEGLTAKLAVYAEQSSVRERLAAEAERATVELKKCEYMADHIGQEYDGFISGVTANGFYVELSNGVEGFVHISSLMDDYYQYWEEAYSFQGSHNKKSYRLGDAVRIEVLSADVASRRIDFILAGSDAAAKELLRQQLVRKAGSAGQGRGQQKARRGSSSAALGAVAGRRRRGAQPLPGKKRKSRR